MPLYKNFQERMADYDRKGFSSEHAVFDALTDLIDRVTELERDKRRTDELNRHLLEERFRKDKTREGA